MDSSKYRNIRELERLLMNSSSEEITTTADAEPLPRLCHLKLTPAFKGYGFNLKSKRDKLCQYIGKVDEGSPADLAGLRDNDRIVEINCKNVEKCNHDQIIEYIRRGLKRNREHVADELLMLVVDREADFYYTSRNLVLKTNSTSTKKIFLSSDIDEVLTYARNKHDFIKNMNPNDPNYAKQSSHHESIIIDEEKLFSHYKAGKKGSRTDESRKPPPQPRRRSTIRNDEQSPPPPEDNLTLTAETTTAQTENNINNDQTITITSNFVVRRKSGFDSLRASTAEATREYLKTLENEEYISI